MNKVTELLMASRDIIKDEKNWTKNAYARNDTGQEVPFCSREASQFCVIGALRKAFSQLDVDVSQLEIDVADRYYEIPGQIIQTLINGDIDTFNDDTHTRHSDIIGILNKAIKISIDKTD